MRRPDRTSLYQPRFEKDSCGFGLIANLDDQPSHWLVETAITALQRLTHRGAIAADGKTGDGCGLLLKLPINFLRRIGEENAIPLSDRCTAGLVFLNPDQQLADRARRVLAEKLADQGLEAAGWREVPIVPDVCGPEALRTLPRIEQLFVNAPGHPSAGAFNRHLFLARRRAEKVLRAEDPAFYVASLSAQTLAYKAMVMPSHLAEFYPDLADPELTSSACVFHQRFSTNTWPEWRLAQPFRLLAHNGEINTIQGNRNWAIARGSKFRSPLLPDLTEFQPIVSTSGSDSSSLDNMVEVLLAGGMDVLQAMRILIPPAWQTVDNIDPDVRAFYEYYGAHVEPWDGPAGIVLTNGRYAACVLDRNGLRPARYVLTRDRHLTIASEVGVYDYRPEDVVAKGRLGPGQMMAADLESGELLDTQRIEDMLKNRAPYKKWLKQGVRYLDSELVDPRLTAEPMDSATLARYQKMFNLSYEERNEVIGVLAETELEAVGSMGDDTPMPVLSNRIRCLFDSFRQQFAQVTNPPIDSLRERMVMSLQTEIGPECNVFEPLPEHARQITMNSPVLSQRKFRQLLAARDSDISHEVIDLQYPESGDLREAIDDICRQAEEAARSKKLLIVLTDRYLEEGKMPVHALLAVGRGASSSGACGRPFGLQHAG